jgi:uncharacterized membrane protein YkoI
MTDKVKNTALVVSSLAALALGGSAIAGAASNDNAASTANSAAATTQADDARPRQRSDETLLTGDAASKVSAAALAKVPGGTIERVETDADGNARYEAHMTNADGSRVTVYVNADFEVVSVESGR